jgi:hypothetical protein
MNFKHRLLMLIGFLLAIVTLAMGVRCWSARRDLEQGLARLDARTAALTRYETSGIVVNDSVQVGTDDLVSQVQRTLTAGGIPNTAFRGIQPLGEHLGEGGGARERAVQINLQAMCPADVGAWLAAWCVPAQPWRVTGVTWTHSDAISGIGTDDNLAGLVTITISARASVP